MRSRKHFLTSTIPQIVAVDFLAHSIHNQVTYHTMYKDITHSTYNNIHLAMCDDYLPYTAYSMILHLPYTMHSTTSPVIHAHAVTSNHVTWVSYSKPGRVGFVWWALTWVINCCHYNAATGPNFPYFYLPHMHYHFNSFEVVVSI